MAVKIKLKRIGKMREPHYRIVVADARTKRDGRAIEEIGQYHPLDDPSRIQVESERVQYWLGVGAQPTEAVAAILRVTGDWQAFKGEPAPPPMKVAEPKADKKSVFEVAAKEAAGIDDKAATTAKAKKKAEPKAESKAESKAGAKAEPKSESKSEAAPKAEPEANASAKSDTATETKTDTATDADVAAEPAAETAGEAQPAEQAASE